MGFKMDRLAIRWRGRMDADKQADAWQRVTQRKRRVRCPAGRVQNCTGPPGLHWVTFPQPRLVSLGKGCVGPPGLSGETLRVGSDSGFGVHFLKGEHSSGVETLSRLRHRWKADLRH